MEIDTPKKTMYCSSPSLTENVPRAQQKPTTEGSPEYDKTPPVLVSKGPNGKKKTNNIKTIGLVHNHPKSKYWTKEETKTQ